MAPEPVAAHVAYLQGCGYSYAQIARAAGVNERTPYLLIANRLRFVYAYVGRAILAVRPNVADLELDTIIPARGLRRRIEALGTRGWSIAAIAAHLGTGRSHISHLAWKDGVTVRNHLMIAGAYDALWDANPPSRDRWEARTILRTQNRAQLLGWAPPLAWDDIDYDDAPQLPADTDAIDVVAVDLAIAGESHVRLTIHERRLAVQHLSGISRLPDTVIGQMLHVDEKTIANDRAALDLSAAVGHDRQPLPRVNAA